MSRSHPHRRTILATRFFFALSALGLAGLQLAAASGSTRLGSGALPLIAMVACIFCALAPYPRSDR